ncbi:MAG: hypothetical protein JXQ90_16455 [Cyclobacteriaceae bacterium]
MNRLISISFALSTTVALLLVRPAHGQEKTWFNKVEDKSIDKAIVILPGFGDSRKGRKEQIKFFNNRGYDIYIPDYADKSSFDNCISNYTQFHADNQLDQYKELHYLTYILGSWVLNIHQAKYPSENIKSIVYDRSPLQERAPKVASTKIPLITKLIKGKVVGEMADVPYLPLEKKNQQIGLIIESKATTLIRFFRKATLALGEIQWQPTQLNQDFDDHMYTRLDHDQMYVRFDVVGDNILSFFENGTFSETARRTAYDWDHFKKYKE